MRDQRDRGKLNFKQLKGLSNYIAIENLKIRNIMINANY